MEYLKRVIDDQLQDYLDAFEAVNIEGPKWCGKTTTAKQKAAMLLYLVVKNHSFSDGNKRNACLRRRG